MSILESRDELAILPNGIKICYRSHGDEQAPAVVLVAGLGLQLVYWPESLIEQLLASGLRVIRFDNRDAGRSSRSTTPHPSLLEQLRGTAPAGCYGLEDMADDTALLIDHLQLQNAHLVGMSMGGMIAQTMAYRHPDRVRSLVSIFSTTGNRKVGQPAISTIFKIATARAPRSIDEAVLSFTTMMRHVGDAHAPDIEADWRRYSALAWERNGNRADSKAVLRQIGAIFKSGDRTQHLRQVQAPTLVVHGDVDRMVHPSGGLATAGAIANAHYQVIVGMRHQIDDVQTRRLAPLVLEHFTRYDLNR